ncbi:MAG: hypothetical protein A2161_17075 [Candidatus Schekmanbacteria bacterium RBG_13_48_7]|uniref:Histidinol-phosphatase n=1 Tax=Candidatus Schekmanbacteria bacterium RBG_13_48_7 TaxID=1817878 RepID=A0A1F7S5K0_9BACT|nr:MAG: hypothetical protein A2161_17075 [Candidatus Schekmanbacteria bacterium RBG_13_48_7]
MVTSNFHTHSVFCDGKGTIINFIETAIEKEMTVLGFSSHAPLPFSTDWAMDSGDLMSYCQSVKFLQAKYADRINLFLGLEIDYIPGVISPADTKFKKYDLDYTIGSVHFVGYSKNNEHWGIDNTKEIFESGLRELYQDDSKKAVQEYYRLVCEMVQNASPSVIGHLDIIKKFNSENIHFNESDTWYRDAVMETLNVISASKCIMEINTSGLHKSASHEQYPSSWILKESLNLNIPIVINADAHKPEQLMQSFPETVNRLLEIGYTEHRVMDLNGWKSRPLQ